MRILALLFALLLPPALQAVDYPAVEPGRALVFPRDGGAHPEYRTEWWYLTGWLVDEQGRERGFQLTFFRVRSGLGEDLAGRFSPAQLILAHAAVADPARGSLLHAQRSVRASGRIAGAATETTEVWLRDWSLRLEQGAYRARISAEQFGYSLELRPTGEAMLNGEGGFSRKGPAAGDASYYYSHPQLAVAGDLRLGGETLKVSGRAWMDQEWSSGYLPEGAVGWDWVGLNLDDGGALMAFRMRDAEGRPLWAGGTLRARDGSTRALQPDELGFEPLRHWNSPRSGVRYPVEWRIFAGGRALRLAPLMDDQELDSRQSTGALYWEGAVRAIDGGTEVGRGYLEMTGYGGRLRM